MKERVRRKPEEIIKYSHEFLMRFSEVRRAKARCLAASVALQHAGAAACLRSLTVVPCRSTLPFQVVVCSR